MDIKAIETRYKGYRFRSRLEARWAVFFDAAGIKYQYEPEGIEFHGETYLPDFYLPDAAYHGCYFEVKPDIRSRYGEIERAARVVCMGIGRPLVVMGDVPYITDCGLWGFLMFGFDQIGGEIYGALVPLRLADGRGYFCQSVDPVTELSRRKMPIILRGSWEYPLSGMSTRDIEAPFRDQDEAAFYQIETKEELELAKQFYNRARSARFEHGEMP